MDPEHALMLYRDLTMANKKMIMGDHLHIIYQITPLPCFVTPPWQNYIDIVERLSKIKRNIIELLGLNMGFFNSLVCAAKPNMNKVKERVRKWDDKSLEIEEKERVKKAKEKAKAEANQAKEAMETDNEEKKDDDQNKNKKKVQQPVIPMLPKPKRDSNGLTYDHKIVIAQRLWGALIICDIVQEVPSMQIAKKCNVDHGLVQSLQAQVSTFAGMVAIFCEKFNWWELQILVSEYQERVQSGFISKHEERKLKPFFKLGHNVMTKTIARLLYDAEITSIELLSKQPAEEIQRLLAESRPFQLKQHKDPRSSDIDPRLGMKLHYLANKYMERKNHAQEQRMQKRDEFATQLNNDDAPPSGTQYNRNHGYKIEPKRKKNQQQNMHPMDRIFHPNLHTQKPYTQLSIKPIPNNLFNTHNEELLKQKTFTPRKRSWVEVTPSQIFANNTPSPLNNRNNQNAANASNSPLTNKATQLHGPQGPPISRRSLFPTQTQEVDINININNNNIPASIAETQNNVYPTQALINKTNLRHPPISALSVIPEQHLSVIPEQQNTDTMQQDDPDHDPEEKESVMEDTNETPLEPPKQHHQQPQFKSLTQAPTEKRRNPNETFSQISINHEHIKEPINHNQPCPKLPIVTSTVKPINKNEVTDQAILGEVFADFFSPGNNGNISDLDDGNNNKVCDRESLSSLFTQIVFLLQTQSAPTSQTMARQLSFRSESSGADNDNEHRIVNEPPLKKQKLGTSTSRVTSTVSKNKSSNPPQNNRKIQVCSMMTK